VGLLLFAHILIDSYYLLVSHSYTHILVCSYSHNRLQSASTVPSLMTVMRSVLKNEGFTALYKGLGVTVARAMPSNACIFLTYEMVKRALAPL